MRLHPSIPLFLAAHATAQTTSFPFEGTPESQLGWSVARAGDVDLDGYDDFLVGSPGETAGGLAYAGRARLYSGRDRSVLHTWWGQDEGAWFGLSVAGVGDVDSDGHPDVIVGAPRSRVLGVERGSVHVYSGANGHTLMSVSGFANATLFGWSVASAGNFDVDGVPDFVVGAPNEPWNQAGDSMASAGGARVFSGVDGAQIVRFGGSTPLGQLGTAVAFAADVNFDGRSDVLVAAPRGGQLEEGRVTLYSGATHAVIHAWAGGTAGSNLGVSLCRLGDTDGDAIADFAFGAPRDGSFGVDSGRAIVVSGGTHAILRTIFGTVGARLGTCVAGPGDVDRDGRGDLFVGSPGAALPLLDEYGKAELYSGATGASLAEFRGANHDGLTGYAVAGAGDVNQDGIPDLLVGSPGDSPAGADAGVARVYLMGGAAGTPFCFGDGSGSACPCWPGNVGEYAGCPNSLGLSGKLTGTGVARIGADTLVLRASGLPYSSSLCFQGSARVNGGAGVLFGDGLRCAGGIVVRLGTHLSSSGGTMYPQDAEPSLSMHGSAQSGQTLHYQVWYRNAAAYCTAETSNLTNGYSVLWQP